MASSRDELLSLFLSGRADDLGLGLYGYTLESTSRDGKYLVRTYASGSRNDIPHVKIVYDNYLPVYCSYIDSSGKEVSKTYFSNYVALQRLSFPCRTTQISYTAKGDSTVTRTIYSNIRADQQDPWFDFELLGQVYSDSYCKPGKKAWKAALASAIIPGAGQWYASDKVSGALTFLLEGAMAAIIVEQWRHYGPPPRTGEQWSGPGSAQDCI